MLVAVRTVLHRQFSLGHITCSFRNLHQALKHSDTIGTWDTARLGKYYLCLLTYLLAWVGEERLLLIQSKVTAI